MLIVAARPFSRLQPYAETGPIFLCAEDCAPYAGGTMRPVLARRTECLLKAYDETQRIIYGTGRITPMHEVEAYCETLLSDAKVAFVDARSATNTCFTLRITRTTGRSSALWMTSKPPPLKMSKRSTVVGMFPTTLR